jgi:hypothetical protein
MPKLDPKLRGKGGVKEPYPLGEFPNGFIHAVASELSVAMATGRTEIEGKDWEQIFAKAIAAEWRPSVVGLDDILVPTLSAAWGAKTIKNDNPFTVRSIRLISGRNSPDYSYGEAAPRDLDAAKLGELVIGIWNERVAALYQKYKTLRTVILIKGPRLEKVSIFEIETIRYNSNEYDWGWNKNNNLVATKDGKGKFTWQPHGAQFTIHETVPDYALNIEIDPPHVITTEAILEAIGFKENSYRVVTMNRK